MIKKTLCILALVALISTGAAFAENPTGLPAVTVTGSCTYLSSIQSQATGLMGLLATAGVTGIEPYATMDLESGANGDGIPDSYQFALFAEAMCAGNGGLIAQFNANKALYAQLVTDLGTVINILLGPPRVDARLQAIADIIAGTPEFMAVPEVAELQATLAGLATEIAGLLDDLDPTLLTLIPTLPSVLPIYADAVSALIGINSEMQSTVTDLLATYQTDIDEYLALAQAAVTQGQALVEPPFSAYLDQTEIDTINGVLEDAATLVVVVQRTLAIPDNAEVYGAGSKAADEPFSAVGDYDGDGNTNLAVYTGTSGAGEGMKEFVEGASGYNKFWSGNPALPVVGMVGFAALAGALALAGARSVRRK